MEYTLENIEDILFDGTEEERERLPSSVSYVFNPKLNSFTISFANMHTIGHGIHVVPKCVSYYGNNHSFGDASSV